MAKRRTRDKTKRKLEQTERNLETVIEVLADAFATYNELHPELSGQMLIIIKALDAIKTSVARLNQEI